MDDGAGAIRLLDAPADSGTPVSSGRVELLLRAQAWLKRGASAPNGGAVAAEAQQAMTSITQSLQTWVADHPRDAQAWQLLASTYAAQGRTLSSIRAQAEINVAQLDYTAALARFKAAQDWVRKQGAGVDHYEASIVDTRTRQIESMVREQALER
jgi:predicted Zn-dependent protease